MHKMLHEQWIEVIRTNLDSVFNMSRLVIEGMRERGFGRGGREIGVSREPRLGEIVA